MLSRREFVRAFGWTGAAAVAPRLIVARGHEAFGELWAAAPPGDGSIHLDSNENPNGPGTRALEALRTAFSAVQRYPYGEADALTSAIARLHGVQPNNVVLGCGSAEVLRMSMQAYTSRTRHLVTAAPTFETPAEYAVTFGVPVQAVRVDASLRLDLDGMEARAAGAGLIYVCNPNNPTALVLPGSTVGAFVQRVGISSPQAAVLVDEAYHEYVDDPGYQQSIPLAVTRRNVIVSRTFSKLYGMAGLRCGYGIAHAETIRKLSRFKLETSVNQLAIAAGLATLADKDHIDRERKVNRDAKEYTRRLFESSGCSVLPSDANFILVDLGRDARSFRDGCRRAGVFVGRAFPPLTNHVRISIGTMDEMLRATPTLRRLVA